jgi:hypothetical protein
MNPDGINKCVFDILINEDLAKPIEIFQTNKQTLEEEKMKSVRKMRE